MTTVATIPGLEDAIERAYRQDPAPGMDPPIVNLASAVEDWTLTLLTEGPWQRWSCADESCPARPAWDKALSVAYGEAAQSIGGEVEALIRDRLADFAARFQSEHPEAELRTD